MKMIYKGNIPNPSAIPSAIRDTISVLTEEANKGVKKVNKDQTRTARLSTVLPPNRFEKLPPIIFKIKINLYKVLN